MRLPALPAAALAACLMTASCASSAPPASALPPPLPAEYAQRCPPPAPLPPTGEVDAVAIALKDLFDLYGQCAGRMADLLDHLERPR